MKERLKQLRRALNLNQQEFADKIGINRGTLANYEVGRNEPLDAVIRLICDKFQVGEEWLRSGTGEMFAQRDPYDELYRMADEMLRDESAEMKRRLVTAILKLSPEQIDRAVDWMMETFDLVPAAAAPDPEEPQEPTIDEKVAAYRAELEAEAASKKLEASRISKEKDA